MKRTIHPMLMTATLLLTGLVMTDCKNDNNAPEQPAKVQTYRMRITASKVADTPTNGPRRVLSLDGTTLNAVWATGEQVSVYNVTKGAALNGHLEAQSGGASTQLEGDLTGTVEAGDILTLRFLSPAYTDQQGTLAYISANCDYAVAENVEVASVSGGQIQAANDAVFANQQAIIRFTLKDAADGTTTLNPTAFAVNDGTSDIATLTSIPASTYAANGDGVLYAAVPGFSGKTITLTATVGADTYIYTKPNVTIDNGSYYTLSAEAVKQASASPSNEIGVFSVSKNKKVTFSKGNLQYQPCTGIWRFAGQQYDYLGNENNNINAMYYSGWIDLFGWGTGTTPTETSTDKYDYYGTFNDWGQNAISNGGNEAGLWRTLSRKEWVYLFHGRSNYDKRFGLGNVAGVNGVIILPDNWDETKPQDLSFRPSVSEGLTWGNYGSSMLESYYYRHNNGKHYTDNSYTAKQWEMMEAAGAVFLPAAGYRYGTTVSYAGTSGYYWSSTDWFSSFGWSDLTAFNLYFNTENLRPGEGGYGEEYYKGLSVRLVQEIQD